MHFFSRFDLNPSIGGCKVVKVVLLDDFVRCDGARQAHVLIWCHWHVLVNILDVGDDEGVKMVLLRRDQDGAVEEALDSG
jgi:hypothetical protein